MCVQLKINKAKQHSGANKISMLQVSIYTWSLSLLSVVLCCCCLKINYGRAKNEVGSVWCKFVATSLSLSIKWLFKANNLNWISNFTLPANYGNAFLEISCLQSDDAFFSPFRLPPSPSKMLIIFCQPAEQQSCLHPISRRVNNFLIYDYDVSRFNVALLPSLMMSQPNEGGYQVLRIFDFSAVHKERMQTTQD